jgi:hypothetical protein
VAELRKDLEAASQMRAVGDLREATTGSRTWKPGKRSPAPTREADLELGTLRELLTEIDVATKLARELPADATAGPLIDAVRARVARALEQSAKLELLLRSAKNGRQRGGKAS